MEHGKLTLRYLQSYIRERQSIHPETDRASTDVEQCAIKLMEELGELSRCVVRGLPRASGPQDLKGSTEEEVCDILYYLLTFASDIGMDLETWMPIKLKAAEERYPSGLPFVPEE